MPRPAKLDAQGLRHRKFWPSYTPDQQELLATFLHAMRVEAEKGIDAARRLEAIATADDGTVGNRDWWEKTVRTIDWLLSRVPDRQYHLELIQAIQEGRACLDTTKPAT